MSSSASTNGQMKPGGWFRLGQTLIFVGAAALLVIHTAIPKLGNQDVLIDGSSIALLGTMAIALLLPRITSLKFGSVEATVGEQERKLADAANNAGVSAATEQPIAELQIAARDPLVSLEESRRKLAQRLTQAADAAAVPTADRANLTAVANALKEKGKVTDKTAAAVASVAEVFDQAWRAGVSSPLIARDAGLVVEAIIGALPA